MSPRRAVVSALAAFLLVVAGAFALGSGSASAAPAAAARAESCPSMSSGFKSWVSFEVSNIACTHAHSIGTKWSNSCGRSSSTVTPMHCTIVENVEGQDRHFACSNKKASQSPSHYHVTCIHEHRSVAFTFFPHGF